MIQITEGDRYHSMPGSTHRKTWEVTNIDGEQLTVKLIDRAVGYDTGEEQIWNINGLKARIQSGEVVEA